ncbi:TPA: hypothetical protein P0E04_005096 [Vibrio campbellii]|nr:hypothetical protein DZA51_00330 [Vibrio campbellii]HDM8045192.1 hypothetical protein [Vibrio campbellii]HDM8046782.1 hypothetical protein [Vibrio campbellii]
MRYESAPVASEEKQENTRERAARQRTERRNELTYSAEDEKRWARNRAKALPNRSERQLNKEMRVTAKLHPIEEEQKVHEYVVSAAGKRIIYPGVIQCITITGVVPNIGIIGTHISPGASKDEIEKTFEILKSGGADGCTSWYLVGNFEQHYEYNKMGWKSDKKIVQYMRSRLGGKARYFSCDISTMAKDFGYTWGTDIYAELDGDRVSFSEKKSASRNKNDECKLIRVAFTEFESSMKCF